MARGPHVGIALHRAWAFWVGTVATALGVLAHHVAGAVIKTSSVIVGRE